MHRSIGVLFLDVTMWFGPLTPPSAGARFTTNNNAAVLMGFCFADDCAEHSFIHCS